VINSGRFSTGSFWRWIRNKKSPVGSCPWRFWIRNLWSGNFEFVNFWIRRVLSWKWRITWFSCSRVVSTLTMMRPSRWLITPFCYKSRHSSETQFIDANIWCPPSLIGDDDDGTIENLEGSTIKTRTNAWRDMTWSTTVLGSASGKKTSEWLNLPLAFFREHFVSRYPGNKLLVNRFVMNVRRLLKTTHCLTFVFSDENETHWSDPPSVANVVVEYFVVDA